jgi:hypothetical protein
LKRRTGSGIIGARRKYIAHLRRPWHATNLGGGHVRAPKDLIQRLEAREIERTGKALTAES